MDAIIFAEDLRGSRQLAVDEVEVGSHVHPKVRIVVDELDDPGRGADTPSRVESGMTNSTGARQPALAGTSGPTRHFST